MCIYLSIYLFLLTCLGTHVCVRGMQGVQMGSYGCLVLGPHLVDIRLPAIGVNRNIIPIVEAVCSQDSRLNAFQ